MCAGRWGSGIRSRRIGRFVWNTAIGIMTTMCCSPCRRFLERRTFMNLLDQFFVYHPHPWEERDWSTAAGVPLEDVWFQSADGTKLFGWYAEHTATSAVLLWCHGNAGNMTHRLENLRALHRLGLSVFSSTIAGTGKVRDVRLKMGSIRMRLGRTTISRGCVA